MLNETLKSIYISVFRYYIYIVQTNDITASCKSRDLLLAPDQNEDNTEAFTVGNEEEAACYIFFRKNPNAGIIAHECYHAVKSLLRWIGAEKEDEEVFAYLLDYVTEKTHKILKNDK